MNISGFIIHLVILPTPINDALPFVGETAKNGLMTMAFVFLLLIVSFGPEGFDGGLPRPFNEGLSPEFVAGIAPVDKMHFTTLLGERCDAAVFLEGRGAVVFFPVTAEKSEQAGGKCGSGPG